MFEISASTKKPNVWCLWLDDYLQFSGSHDDCIDEMIALETFGKEEEEYDKQEERFVVTILPYRQEILI